MTGAGAVVCSTTTVATVMRTGRSYQEGRGTTGGDRGHRQREQGQRRPAHEGQRGNGCGERGGATASDDGA
jgi:hypothetical protein